MKKKGSALVFSVLILSFFLAISLNLFFQARKKAERAGVKVRGERITNNIDIASTIAYEELQTAAAFTVTGFLYDPSHPISTSFSNKDGLPIYSSGDSNPLHIDLSTGFYTEKYAGVHLNNFIHYFSSAWHYDNGDANKQKLVIGEILNTDGLVTGRSWQSSGIPNKLSYLWNEAEDARSLGGYALVGTFYLNDLTTEIDLSVTGSITETEVAAIYEKIVRLKGNSHIDSVVLKIQVTESFTYEKSGGVETLEGRDISDFIVEVLE